MRDHRGGGAAGRVAYVFYRALSHAVSPLLHLHIRCWRRLRGLEHPDRWPERLGRPSSPRPPGPLLWFHAVSLGEGLAVVPLIRHCLQQQQQQQPSFVLLMTTTTTSAFEVIKDQLPIGVIYQFAPLDTPVAVGAFLKYWNPIAIFLMESELWPNLILSAAENGIAVALLNARMSAKSFKLWSGPVARHLISLMLSKFCLIASLSTVEAVRFQLLHAQPFIINFPGDLKYAVGDSDVAEKQAKKAEELHLQLANRPVWMASSIHSGEEEVVLWVHKELIDMYPDMITIIVPRHPQHGNEIARALSRQGLKVMLRSRSETISSSTSFYVVDTLGELKALYWITPIAVIGGSFLPGLAGHNMSEAAAASCAVLIGPHVGHFSYMVSEMLRSDSLSVWQVSGKVELVEALRSLLGDSKALEARQRAAKLAFSAVSEGVVRRVWDLIDAHVLKKQGKESCLAVVESFAAVQEVESELAADAMAKHVLGVGRDESLA